MPSAETGRRWNGCRWTLGLFLMLVGLNAGVFSCVPPAIVDLLPRLQLDVTLVRLGQWERLFTGNLVHWSPQHFYLDGSAFLVAGLLGERYYRGLYPWLLGWTALAVGAAGLWLMPEGAMLRGLSGVNAGQFAALVIAECIIAYRCRSRWLWVAPATALFVTWLVFGSVTGRYFGGALFLQGGGKVAGWAHVAGAVAAVAFVVVARWTGRWTGPVEEGHAEEFEAGNIAAFPRKGHGLD